VQLHEGLTSEGAQISSAFREKVREFFLSNLWNHLNEALAKATQAHRDKIEALMKRVAEEKAKSEGKQEMVPETRKGNRQKTRGPPAGEELAQIFD
jgi:hypothetical protein